MSATPVTVTDCSAFQSEEVNVRLEGDTVPSEGSEETTVTVTLSGVSVSLSVGCEDRRTLNVAVVVFSSVSFEIAET